MNRILKALQIEVKEFCHNNLHRDYIKESFSEAGFKNIDDYERFTKRGLVEEYYSSVNWHNKDTINKFYQAIRNILIKTPWLSEASRKYLINTCQELGFNIEDFNSFYLNSDFFAYQFPSGLPFGKIKPNFAVKAEKGSQSLKFEWQHGIGILTNSIYPNLTFQKLTEIFKCTPETDIALRRALKHMNQTECEDIFFINYARKFNMASQNIPVLIPQAWIQWHSLIKKQLYSGATLHANDIYRVDFVAFWDNKRYAIQIDDINHYAIKKNNLWIADENSYSKTLKNDRILVNEGWKLFKVSNWEIKNIELLEDSLNDLKNFLDF